MKTTLLLTYLIVLLIPFESSLLAQEISDTTTYQLSTNEGNTFIGQILKRDSSFYVFRTKTLGDLTIQTRDIKKIKVIEGVVIKDGSYWLENPQSTRHFWSPNGYGLKKGEGYYQNVWVLFNQVAYGVTDYFSIGGGTLPLFIFGGGATPVWITPKFSIPVQKNKFNLGVGGLFGHVFGEDDLSFGILYGSATIGSRDQNVSFGLGWGYSGGDWMKTPMVNAAGLFRLGSRSYLVTENYYIEVGGDYLILLSLGGRQIIKSIGLDYGAFVPITSDLDAFVLIPWLGLTVPFGK